MRPFDIDNGNLSTSSLGLVQNFLSRGFIGNYGHRVKTIQTLPNESGSVEFEDTLIQGYQYCATDGTQIDGEFGYFTYNGLKVLNHSAHFMANGFETIANATAVTGLIIVFGFDLEVAKMNR